MPWFESRVLTVKGNDHNEFGLQENTTNRRGCGLHLTDIFYMFGAPFILQSDNGHKFANKIIQNLTDMWPGMKLVHGKPRHSQSQGSVERPNQDVREMLVAWISDNNTKTWSEGLRFIQSKKTPSSAFRHQDKPLWGYVWNGAEDRSWGFSAHWRHTFVNRNWRTTGTAL